MYNIRLLLLCVIFPFFTSCGNNENAHDVSGSDTLLASELIDSAFKEMPDELIEIIPEEEKAQGEFTGFNGFPHRIDSNFFAVSPKDRGLEMLTGEQVVALSENYNKEGLLADAGWVVQECKRLDTLKEEGKYEAYLETLDLGMTRFADAYVMDTISFDNGLTGVTWCIAHGSYEACPYYSGVIVNLSLLKDGNAIWSGTVGEDQYSGDPPMWYRGRMFPMFTDNGNIDIYKVVLEGGEEEEEPYDEIVDTTITTHQFNINGLIGEK